MARQGPLAGGARRGSWLSRQERGHRVRLPCPHSSLFSSSERTGTEQSIRSESLPSPPPDSPARRGPRPPGSGPGPRQVHKLTLPPLPRRQEPAGSPRPRPTGWARGPPGGAPPPCVSSPPERAPVGCDWLIQTHLQRNASLRVPVGVQFKSAAPGARGQAGAGSEDDSCAGASPKAAVGFLKRLLRRGKKTAEVPPTHPRSAPPSLGRRASPFPNLPQPDFGREQNPKRTRWSRLHPTPPRSRKSKDLGQRNRDLSPTLRKGSGTRAERPPRTPAIPLHPPGARLPRAPTPSPAPRRPPARVLGDCERETCAGKACGSASPARPAACSAQLTASLRVRRSHSESGH